MSMTWREAHERAIRETREAYRGEVPSKDDWLSTFETFYDELIAENRITIYPVDPPGSRRMAVSRATIVWTDDYSDR